MKKSGIYLIFILILCMSIFAPVLVSCGTNASDTPVDEYPDGEILDSGDDFGGDDNTDSNISRTPSMLKMINSIDSVTQESLKLVCGESEPFTTITITGDNINTVQQYTGRSRFFIPIYLLENKNCKITITAQTDGKEPSPPLTLSCSKISSYAMTSFVVGSDNFVHFPDVANFMCNNYTSKRNMENIYKTLCARYENIRNATGKDTKFFILLMPDPLVLYPESASAQLQQMRSNAISDYNKSRGTSVDVDEMYTNMNAVADYINGQNPPFTLVDMSMFLRELKEEETYPRIYHTTDNHWSSYGAYYGYRTIMEFVYETSGIEGTKPLELEDFTIEDYKLSYSGQLGMPDPASEGIYEVVDLLVPKIERTASLTSGEILNDGRFWSDVRYKMSFTTGREELPTAVFLRDSFTTALYPMLNEHFHNTYYSDTWDYTVDYNWLAQVKPDYVFVIAVERLSASALAQR